MNVLFVQPALPHYRVSFFQHLRATSGFNVTVWSDHSSPLHTDATSSGLATAHCAEIHRRGLVWQPALWDAVSDPWADVVVLSWNTRYVHLLPALIEARRRSRPVVLWGHGYSKTGNPLLHWLRNSYGRLARACVTYSERTRARLIAEGFRPERVFAAPNALDAVPLQQLRSHWLSEPESLRLRAAELGITASATVLFVSRFEASKRPVLLVEAFALVLRQVPNAKLVMVGAGPELPNIRARIANLGLGQSILLTGPIYDDHQLAPLFLSATVFAYPIDIGLSLLHAFNFGLPVVTSDRAEHHGPEFDCLINSVNGLTFHEGNVPDFAQQLVSVLTNPTLRAQLSRSALSAVSPPNGRTLEPMVTGMVAAIAYAARSE